VFVKATYITECPTIANAKTILHDFSPGPYAIRSSGFCVVSTLCKVESASCELVIVHSEGAQKLYYMIFFFYRSHNRTCSADVHFCVWLDSVFVWPHPPSCNFFSGWQAPYLSIGFLASSMQLAMRRLSRVSWSASVGKDGMERHRNGTRQSSCNLILVARCRRCIWPEVPECLDPINWSSCSSICLCFDLSSHYYSKENKEDDNVYYIQVDNWIRRMHIRHDELRVFIHHWHLQSHLVEHTYAQYTVPGITCRPRVTVRRTERAVPGKTIVAVALRGFCCS
jgi:hypothetical protein